MRVGSTTPDPEPRCLSLEEWAALPEDEPGELLDGMLVQEEIPDLVHETVVAWLLATLRAWIRPRGGLVVGSELKLAVARRRGRKADLCAWLPGHARLRGRGLVRVPPDVLVEVVSRGPSDGRRDRVDKAADYAGFGVRWYWLVDPERRVLEVLALADDGRYEPALSATRGTVGAVPGCPGLTLDLDGLWAEVDELDLSEPGPDDAG